MKYFLTGATGFVGNAVARRLRQQGHEVVALVRTPAKAAALAAIGVQVVQGDVTDKASMRGPMQGVDGVFHIAGWYKIGTPDKRDGVATNVEGTRHVLALMAELQIPKGVYTSTLAVNSNTYGVEVDENYRFIGRHLSVYDETKAAAHQIAEEFIDQGLPLVIVQPGLIYGPGDQGPSHDALVQFLKRRLPLIPAGTGYSWAHIDDIAQAHVAAMEKGRSGESYLICGPSATFAEAVTLMARISGVPAPALTAPPVLLSFLSGTMALVEKFVKVPPTFTAEYLRVSAGVTYMGDHSKARTELGFAPRSLEEGMQETIAWEMKELGMTKAPKEAP
jgi:nucleoside-diphosphate-sugar epimerase